MGRAAEALARPAAPPADFAALYPRLRDACDLDALDRLGDPWRLCEGLKPAALQNLLRYLLSEARDAETSRRLAALHRFWGDSAALEAASHPLPPLRARRRSTPLRVGLLSADLRRHPVGLHLLPLLRHYDRRQFEIVAFSPDERPDDPVQADIRGCVSGFEIVGNLSLRDTATRIREADIDVLLELNGHTQGSRLGALAYRAAPVQMEWLGYQFTTGLPAADYFLMDSRLAPPNTGLLCEAPLFLPGSWVCFAGPDAAEIALEPPLVRNGFVTFGTLAHPFKFTRASFAAWARALKAVPGSRFLLVRPETGDADFRAHVTQAFAREGIAVECVAFYDNAAAGVSHFSCYNELDVALDTVPVSGGTTTCDALWMGVPVVTLVGPALHQRLSFSLLAGAGLQRLCAITADEYARIAVALAGDCGTLARLRLELRDRVRRSALGDAPRFAANFAAALNHAARR
jgi:predicted O-linked N-acetylglucosamine transferase (SPINDLY family)